MIVVTTPTIEGREIIDTLGMVTGSSVAFASGPQQPLTLPQIEQATSSAMEIAQSRMLDKAIHLGAHAVVGVSIDVTALAHGQAAVASYAQGTAVVLKDIKRR